MSFIIPSIFLSLISFVMSLFGLTYIAEWIVWYIYILISLFLFFYSFKKYIEMIKGHPQSPLDVMGIATYPFVTTIMTIILIALLYVDYSKLHILWLYPIVGFIFEFTIGRRAANKI